MPSEKTQVRDGDRKAASRANTRDLVIPKTFDPIRRRDCELDDCEWLRVYCGEVFYNPFTAHQKKIIADCGESLQYGTQKCKAAPRGDGKSSIVKYLALKYALARQVKFPLIVAATSSKGKKTLNSLKRRLATRADSPLVQDYPVECVVARYVDPWPSRARNVTANGQRPIHVEWGPDWFILPTFEDEEPLGPIVMSLGVTSDDLQGCNIYDQRPDFVMLDDLDSRDSLAAENGIVAAKVEEAIDKTIAGLGGQSRRLGQFMLCTITSREAAAFKYSDPAQKPAWSGERIAAIGTWPDRRDLWDHYIELRQNGKSSLDADGRPEDVHGRKAHQHYLDNREVMDAGAAVSNPYNFEADPLPDGSQKHVSALQKCFDYIADKGLESFQTEHQNDPPEALQPIESGITSSRVQRQVSGIPRNIVPHGTIKITQGIDVKKVALHWVVRAWTEEGSGYTIGYGVQEVRGTTVGSDVGLDEALQRALDERREQVAEYPYMTDGGEVIEVSRTIVDSRWRKEAIYAWCNRAGLNFMPSMGYGRSQGCAGPRFGSPSQSTPTKKVGDQYVIAKQASGIWLVEFSADSWKAWEHDRWMSDPLKPGALHLFGDGPSAAVLQKNPNALSFDQKAHMSYSKHITSEVEVEEPLKGGGMIRKWKNKNNNNHWLDASVLANIAASIEKVPLVGRLVKASSRVPQGKRPSLQELANKARNRS